MAVPQLLDEVVGRPVQILLVEDSTSDVAMTAAALAEGRIANRLSVVSDGEQALAYVRREGDYAESARPDLILLDLNLPKRDGREVLAELKADPDLKVIPVIVLTTSAAEIDILRSYRLHANAYVTKPLGPEALLDAILGIEDFWLALVRITGRDRRVDFAPVAVDSLRSESPRTLTPERHSGPFDPLVRQIGCMLHDIATHAPLDQDNGEAGSPPRGHDH